MLRVALPPGYAQAGGEGKQARGESSLLPCCATRKELAGLFPPSSRLLFTGDFYGCGAQTAGAFWVWRSEGGFSFPNQACRAASQAKGRDDVLPGPGRPLGFISEGKEGPPLFLLQRQRVSQRLEEVPPPTRPFR